MASISASTFISDTVINIRDRLSSNITDPISSSRSGRERFVMTSYPQREVKYPVIIVEATDIVTPRKLGHGSEGLQALIPLKITIAGRNVKERDALFQKITHYLRTNQDAGSGTNADGMFDFRIRSSVTVDEEGDNAIKKWIVTADYFVLLV